MDAQQYRKKHGRAKTIEVCRLAGTKYSWFKLCATGHGRFSVDTARALVEASGGEMTLEKLLPPKSSLRNAQHESTRATT
jgi:hypothetical protein